MAIIRKETQYVGLNNKVFDSSVTAAKHNVRVMVSNKIALLISQKTSLDIYYIIPCFSELERVLNKAHQDIKAIKKRHKDPTDSLNSLLERVKDQVHDINPRKDNYNLRCKL